MSGELCERDEWEWGERVVSEGLENGDETDEWGVG
ncbi:hypothetical protein Pcinc_042925, partial [Petrolisthes cinctipes]